jgi:beta-glucosidase
VDEDADLLRELGIAAYRFSVSWPRIQPDGRGRANQAGLDHYRRLVDALRERDIAPVLTLFHWDLPQALEDAGGWPSRDTAKRFADYAALVADALADEVEIWLTVNEPAVAAWLGYATGVHAPGRRDEDAAWAATHHLLLAHGHAIRAIRAASASPAGIALNLFPCEPASERPVDVRAAELADEHLNRLFLDPVFGRGYPESVLVRSRALQAAIRDGDLDVIGAPLDVLGVNYYTVKRLAAAPAGAPSPELPASLGVGEVPADGPTTATGWAVRPDGLTTILERVARDHAPTSIVITENGAAFDDAIAPDGWIHDEDRIAYLRDHVTALRTAVERGVPVDGYLVWSLLDNFEWAEGYGTRFGIVHVDFATQRRTPKDSARWYRDLIAGDA